MSRRGLALLAILLAAPAACDPASSVDPEPRPPSGGTRRPPLGTEPYSGGLRILMVGNSMTYWNDLPQMIAGLSLAMGDSVPAYVRSIAFPGASLEDHLELGMTMDSIGQGTWDAVIMQQGPSSLPQSRDHLIRHTRIFNDSIRAIGARPALYMVYPSVDWQELFDGTILSYKLAADTVDGVLLPVGAAVRETLSRHPQVQLYGSDGAHPAEPGSYLTAIMIYGCLSGRSPRDFPSEITRPSDGHVVRLSSDIATRLRAVAVDVLGSHGRACARPPGG